MNYLITAAGKGSRFLAYGIKPPKPLIRVFGIELLIWSLNSFNFKEKDKVFIVTLKKHNVKETLQKKINAIYPDIKIAWLELNDILEGQLLTAIKAIAHFNIDGPLTIHNCDTFHRFQNEEINKLLKDNIFGVIPCFSGEGDHWSFAKGSKKDSSIAVEVQEKKRISKNCSVGTYIFSSSKELISIFDEYSKMQIGDSDEFFIAPIYQYAIKKKFIVKISNSKEVKVFGTPQELLNSFDITFNQLLGENAWDGNQNMTLVVDIDKTICQKGANDNYLYAKPNNNVVKALRKAHSEGVYIILFTSRNMRTFKGSIGLINKITAPIILEWLSVHKVPYDEIYYGKPWGNSVRYVDDKNLSIDDLINKYVDL